MDSSKEHEERDNMVSLFLSVTGASHESAARYLDAADWDVQEAIDRFMIDKDTIEHGSESTEPIVPPGYTGPRTLDGRPAPEASGSSAAAKKPAAPPAKQRGLRTLGDLAHGGHAGHGHAGHGHDHSDDDDDDSDDDFEDESRGPRDLFAGGEKSGLAVQDPAAQPHGPKKLINDIIAKAKANSQRPEEQPGSGPSQASRFRGSGVTLGGDGVESRKIPDPRGTTPQGGAGGRAGAGAAAQLEGEMQERVLHIWSDGFSIDDGPLRRFDDPENQADLNMIRQGRAPLHLMNVRYDQPVDVKLQQHRDNWRQLPKIYRPFGGEGRRLGSPVPGESVALPPPAPAAAVAPAPATSVPSSAPAMVVDTAQPTLMLRIQLPDGTRLPARFNTTHTVGDVYAFVAAASPEAAGREWVLATTFPSKEHSDKDAVLGELPEFKRGGTAVVKWV